MRKSLMAIGLAGILAVPAGVALAADTPEPTDGVAVVAEQTQLQDQNQDRNQLRLHDPAECDQDGAQMREQMRSQAQLNDGSGYPGLGQVAQNGTGPNHDGADGGGYGDGPQDGTGPIHEGPQDGTGNQYGRGGR